MTSLVLTAAVAAAWVASLMSFPHVHGPTPGADADDPDRVLACLLGGRLVALRRVATLATNSPGLRMTLQEVPVPPDPNDWRPVPRVRVDLRDARAVTVQDYSANPPRFAPQSYQTMMSERDVVGSYPWGWLGFDFGGGPAAKKYTIGGGSVSVAEQVWAVPLWPLLLASATPGARWAWRNRRSRRRLREGRCAACGYDLRASRERCPECGAEAATRPAA